jgi:hypothetical protein
MRPIVPCSERHVGMLEYGEPSVISRSGNPSVDQLSRFRVFTSPSPALIAAARRHHQLSYPRPKFDRALDGSPWRAYVSLMTLHRSLLTALLATASSMHTFGQAAAPAPAPAAPSLTPGPALAPAAPPAPALTPGPALNPAANAAIPFKNASFEEPVVTKRTLDTQGGNPATIE